jgi:hypothetical protein
MERDRVQAQHGTDTQIAGAPKPAPIKGNAGGTFSVPTIRDYTIGDASVVVLGPPQVFTADNIDQLNFWPAAIPRS